MRVLPVQRNSPNFESNTASALQPLSDSESSTVMGLSNSSIPQISNASRTSIVQLNSTSSTTLPIRDLSFQNVSVETPRGRKRTPQCERSQQTYPQDTCVRNRSPVKLFKPKPVYISPYNSHSALHSGLGGLNAVNKLIEHESKSPESKSAHSLDTEIKTINYENSDKNHETNCASTTFDAYINKLQQQTIQLLHKEEANHGQKSPYDEVRHKFITVQTSNTPHGVIEEDLQNYLLQKSESRSNSASIYASSDNSNSSSKSAIDKKEGNCMHSDNSCSNSDFDLVENVDDEVNLLNSDSNSSVSPINIADNGEGDLESTSTKDQGYVRPAALNETFILSPRKDITTKPEDSKNSSLLYHQLNESGGKSLISSSKKVSLEPAGCLGKTKIAHSCDDSEEPSKKHRSVASDKENGKSAVGQNHIAMVSSPSDESHSSMKSSVASISPISSKLSNNSGCTENKKSLQSHTSGNSFLPFQDMGKNVFVKVHQLEPSDKHFSPYKETDKKMLEKPHKFDANNKHFSPVKEKNKKVFGKPGRILMNHHNKQILKQNGLHVSPFKSTLRSGKDRKERDRKQKKQTVSNSIYLSEMDSGEENGPGVYK